MKRTPLVRVRLCLCGIVFTTLIALRGAEPAGIVILQADHLVEMSQDGTRWIRTQAGQPLRPNDWLRTGPDARAAVRMSDASVVPLGPGTAIQIEAPKKAETSFTLRLVKGVLSFFHRDKPGSVRVLTRGGVAGIDGTEFVIAVDDNGQTTVSVIHGKVSFSNENVTLALTNGNQAVSAPGQPPRRVAGFVVNHVLQWAFYYPAILDLRDVALSANEKTALADSLAAYRAGDLLAALEKFGAREPASEAEQIYHAALLLSVGEVERAESALKRIDQNAASEQHRRDAAALRQLISTVRREEFSGNRAPQSATELLAASYHEQSLARGDVTLVRALSLARQATTNSPEFSFAWARVAELEFSFGNTRAANDAVTRSLTLAPRNAQALALKGFLRAADNKTAEALDWFNRAIAVDASLGNAWLGRGLCRIRKGDVGGGREDLLVAAALEPRRAQLRSYLGKAYADAGETKLALHELSLAKEMDANDPTAWLYSSLVNAQNNRINEAIRDLEHSKELNENRSVFRSSLMVDRDRAVRSANLALIYRDAGMSDVAVREASRAVTADYENYSAHLFLAGSYRALRNSTTYDQRFETVALSEYLLTQLLGPPDGRLLAQSVSQGEYTALFQQNEMGLSSTTEYWSRGAFLQAGAVYGSSGRLSFSLEAAYASDPGEYRNTDFESRYLTAKAKAQITASDGLFFQIQDFRQEAGDLAQRYNARRTSTRVHVEEEQSPNFLVGWDHRWNPANLTLFLFTHINDSFSYTNFNGGTYLLATSGGTPLEFVPTDLSQRFRSDISLNSFELQHLVKLSDWQTIVGIRFQEITDQIANRQRIQPGNAINYEFFFGFQGSTITNQHVHVDGYRISPYLYEYWRILDSLLLVAGVSYDVQEQPENPLYSPVSEREEMQYRISPKAAIVWTPSKRFTARAAYSQSLGGVDLAQSVRLEPSQLAGFVQSYRTLFPDSIVGGISGAEMETLDGSCEYRFPTDTYFAIFAQRLTSEAKHRVGVFSRDDLTMDGPPLQVSQKLRFEQNSFGLDVHQLLGEMFAVGGSYRVSDAELRTTYPSLPAGIRRSAETTLSGLTHTIGLNAHFFHPSGFFGGVESSFWIQELTDSLGRLNPDPFWQVNLEAGYRWWNRRAEVSVGLLNATDESYQLHPINLHPDMAQARTFYARFRLTF